MRTVLAATLFVMACVPPPPQDATTEVNDARGHDPWLDAPACAPDVDVSDLRVEDLTPGDGKQVIRGDTVRVHYTAAVPGSESAPIHDSRASGAPIEIVIGSTKTPCGFDKALVGMRAGGKRRVFVPWRLAFGESGHAPDVGPRADLVFVIDLFLPATPDGAHGSGVVRPAGGGRRR